MTNDSFATAAKVLIRLFPDLCDRAVKTSAELYKCITTLVPLPAFQSQHCQKCQISVQLKLHQVFFCNNEGLHLEVKSKCHRVEVLITALLIYIYHTEVRLIILHMNGNFGKYR